MKADDALRIHEGYSELLPFEAPIAADLATQDIPPALRRSVMRRDRGCCVVPGCKHRNFVDVHHLLPRSDGGAHEPDNLVVLCAAHHRALHRGQLLVEGRPSVGLIFRHADGTAYGQGPSPRLADAHARVFSALRNLGFRESEAKQAWCACVLPRQRTK
ncbi:MAG TPA: HNH endonuclease signature motif containing protein [Polyangiaceae bacterium]|jgi:hypothetical protein|nr:HNH endonuclease signature motif containing protein [Polyangiaceae bacterium]